MNEPVTVDPRALRAIAYGLLRSDPDARDPHLRLYEVEQILGEPASALDHLRAAVRRSRVVTTPARIPEQAVSLLALTRVALWEANLPLELIVDEDHTTVHRLYIADEDDDLIFRHALPAYDVIFNTIAESERAQPVLRLAQRLVDRLGATCIDAPNAVLAMSRDAVAARFAASATVIAPPVERVGAAALRGRRVTAPLIVRPFGSQAGIDLAKIDDDDALAIYLDAHSHPEYFVMPFVDYRNADGLYRKYRVMFVDGRAYPCHLAISPRWMIHYYNAPMAENQWMRDEESRFIGNIDDVFTGTARAALEEIGATIPLEYFGIDCAIASDERVLLFEADSAMLVHGTDPQGLFPYKPAGFARIKRALAAAIRSRVRPPV